MPGANGSGGKRAGAGAKLGNHNALKRRGLTEYADVMLGLAEKWIKGKNVKRQQWAFKELLPYVFSKQPMEVRASGPDGGPIQYQEIRESLAGRIARLSGSFEEADLN